MHAYACVYVHMQVCAHVCMYVNVFGCMQVFLCVDVHSIHIFMYTGGGSSKPVISLDISLLVLGGGTTERKKQKLGGQSGVW